MVKRLSRRPVTAQSGVRFPLGPPMRVSYNGITLGCQSNDRSSILLIRSRDPRQLSWQSVGLLNRLSLVRAQAAEPTLRVSYNGNTLGFQPKAWSSILHTRSIHRTSKNFQRINKVEVRYDYFKYSRKAMAKKN